MLDSVLKLINSSIDSYSYIGVSTHLVHTTIGKYCSISSDCNIGLAIHPINNLSTSQIFVLQNNPLGYKWTDKHNSTPFKKIAIGNDVWIGTNVTIMGGVKIGNGVIIGACSVVTKDIPDYAIVVGVPAKIIRYRFEKKIIEKLLKLNWWDLSKKDLILNLFIFENPDLDLSLLNKFKI